VSTLTIPSRFNGPATSGNGGVVSGLLAGLTPDAHTGTGSHAVQVTLRRPPPLGRPLEVRQNEGTTQLWDGEELVASSTPVDLGGLGQAIPPVDLDTATQAAAGYPGLEQHPFPTCFACGTERPDHDGLALQPGPVHADRTRTACPFVLRDEHLIDDPASGPPTWVLWAALDCPGGWTIDLPNRPAVLGRMSARIIRLPAVGEPCVVMGVLDERDGRKSFSRTTIYGSDGHELGRAAATWIDVPV
jgi:hypothetical protein